MINNLKKLQKNINISFRNEELLKNVFAHRSYLNENKGSGLESNEKLEFLGDSVLSLITSVYLYKNYPDLSEGIYTEIKSAIVRTESLAEAAMSLGLGEYLYLSYGEEKGGGRKNKNILADCFEALIAAIFLDQNFTKAYNFVDKYLFKDKLRTIIENNLYQSPKSKLQELTQQRSKTIPEYRILEESGPEHKRVFTVGVFFEKKKLAVATGATKKEAEEKAAKEALRSFSNPKS